MKITVITVCYNAQDCIEATIESVLKQTYTNIEYIIKDGNSNDSTNEIIKKYLSDTRIRYVSTSDTGLYDAMNYATDLATGDYVIFMNAGDVFYSINTVEAVENELHSLDEIIYGDVLRRYKDTSLTESYYKKSILKMILCGKMMSHQSIFIRTDIMKKYRYDTSYSITADFDFVVRAYRDKLSFKYIPVTISSVECITGISSNTNNIKQMRQQDDLSLKKNLPVWYFFIHIPKSIYRKIRSV